MKSKSAVVIITFVLKTTIICTANEIYGYPQDNDTKYLDQNNRRIVGGSDVDIQSYPYHVGYGKTCAGAIISERWVLTVAHCGRRNSVFSGSKLHLEGRETEIKRHIVHPQWSRRMKEHDFDYDFQLLELKQNLQFGPSTQPVRIARPQDVRVSKMVTVTGWGSMVEHGTESFVLRAIQIPIINQQLCRSVPFPYVSQVTDRMFCAGYSNLARDACQLYSCSHELDSLGHGHVCEQGDSGGPAVFGGILLGLVSFGYGCATPGSYGVYSNVASVRDWISSVTGLKLV